MQVCVFVALPRACKRGRLDRAPSSERKATAPPCATTAGTPPSRETVLTSRRKREANSSTTTSRHGSIPLLGSAHIYEFGRSYGISVICPALLFSPFLTSLSGMTRSQTIGNYSCKAETSHSCNASSYSHTCVFLKPLGPIPRSSVRWSPRSGHGSGSRTDILNTGNSRERVSPLGWESGKHSLRQTKTTMADIDRRRRFHPVGRR